MSRLVSTSKLVTALADSTVRKGYSSAAAAMIGRASRSAVEEQMMMMKRGSESGGETVWSASWVPDPITGDYRPANRVGEMDPAELRRIMLARKS